LINLGFIFDLSAKEKEVINLEKKTAEPDFWKDQKKAYSILKRIDSLKNLIERWKKLKEELDDGLTLYDLASEDSDPKSLKEAERNLFEIKERIEKFELLTILSDEDDPKDALLTIHPGAGGTESCDWAEMLLRMYLRWVEKKGFKHKIIDYQPGDEAGIKNATVEVLGEYAYGF